MLLLAQPHSDNYILKKWAISSGGGSMSSTNYQAVAVVGQSSPPGVSSSTNYTLYSGFLGPIFGLPGSALVWIWTDSIDVHIDWDDVPNANTYFIYRSVDPAFVPSPANLIGSTTSSAYIDVGAVADPGTKFFYRITCSN
jgi:hypothetical protein